MEKVIDKVLSFLKYIWAQKNPFIFCGKYLLSMSGLGVGSIIIQVKTEYFTLLIGDNDFLTKILTLILFVLGLICIFIGLKKEQKNKIQIFLFKGFPLQNSIGVEKCLPPIEQYKASEPEVLSSEYSYAFSEIKDRHSYLKQRLRMILEDKNKVFEKVYIAGLGSIPFLYALSSLMRDGFANDEVLEHNRNSNHWFRLEEHSYEKHKLEYSFNDYTSIDSISVEEIILTSDEDEVGVAISFTNKINSNELPISIRENTIHLSIHGQEKTYYLIKSKSLMDSIVLQIHRLIASLSKRVRKVHLFICAQSSFVVSLGKVYQSNMYTDLVIHNYNSNIKGYDWGIEISKGEISEYKVV